MTIDNYISLILVAILIIQYLWVAVIGMRMIKSGYNGIIRAIVVNRVVVSILLSLAFINYLYAIPDEILMLSLFSLVGSNLYMHAALNTEANRPVRNPGRTMRRIYRDIEDKKEK